MKLEKERCVHRHIGRERLGDTSDSDIILVSTHDSVEIRNDGGHIFEFTIDGGIILYDASSTYS